MRSPTATLIVAISVLVLCALVVVVRVLRHFGTTQHTWAQMPLYYLNLLYSLIVWRAKIMGTLPADPDQGAVVVCNHASAIDPAFVQLASKRMIHWMVAREYCLHPLIAWLFRITECIPVNRGGIDTAATKISIRYCSNGGMVGMFPEGRINMTDKLLLPGRPGAALIALKAQVPVIPCYLTGAPYHDWEFGCFLITAKTRLKIGEPIDLSEYYGRHTDKEVLGEVTRLFMKEIARLAGVEDYQPALAGRLWSPIQQQAMSSAQSANGE